MGTADGDGIDRPPAAASRSQQLAKALKETDFLAQLRKTHDVAVFPFSEDLKRDHVVTLAKQTPRNSRTADAADAGRFRRARCPRSGAPDWTKLLAPTGSRNAAGPGPAAIDPGGTRHAGFGHCRLQRRRAKRRHLAGVGRCARAGSENPRLHRRARIGSAADERGRLRSGGAGPGVSRRPLHGDRLSSGPRDGGQSGYRASAFAAGRQRSQLEGEGRRRGDRHPAGHARRRRRSACR